MRRLLQAGLVLVILSSLLVPFVSTPPPLAAAPARRGPRGPLAQPANLPPYAPDEVLVAFQPGVRAETVAQAVGARVQSQIQGLGVHVLKVPQGAVEATLRSLERNPLVEFAEPNGMVYAFLTDPNDPYDNTGAPNCYMGSDFNWHCQWAWGVLQAYQAWDTWRGSPTVKVAVVDTGIDIAFASGLPNNTPHEDLGAACGNSYTVVSWVRGESGIDDNGHGTHIAGIVGACTDNAKGTAGANWYVHLIGEKVLAWYGGGTWSQVASGIRDAADRGARVINLSLGGSSGSRTLERAVNYAWNRGAVLACAAGNSGNTARSYPAYYTNCIAVAATDPGDNRASWSTYGSWVEVAAPGVDILSTVQDQFEWCYLCWGEGYFEGYDALSGTSMATSFVSALAALLWAEGECTTNTCVRNRIENNTDPVNGSFVTKGRINFLKALSATGP
jgi:thermitase